MPAIRSQRLIGAAMSARWLFLGCTPFALCICVLANLSIGATPIPMKDVVGALFRFDPDNYNHFIVYYQRLPRALIAIYVGAVMACGGTILQGLTRNPLASPSTLGINAGAALFVILGIFVLNLDIWQRGFAGLVGALVGFLVTVFVARLAGLSRDPRGLSLILSGSLISMLFLGIMHAFLLADPSRRVNLLGWVTGNINHVYADRLYDLWWIGVLALVMLMALARALTLITLGPEKAESAGVNVTWVSRITLLAIVFGAGSAVAICGPIGFIGLIVPHIVRPFAGAGFRLNLPACAMVGASICLLADLIARHAFAPYVLHTGVILDLIGGLVFAAAVKQFYLTARAREHA